MAGFKQPDFIERREAAAKARKLALEKFRAKAESAERVRALQAEQKAARDARYAARKSRSKRR